MQVSYRSDIDTLGLYKYPGIIDQHHNTERDHNSGAFDIECLLLEQTSNVWEFDKQHPNGDDMVRLCNVQAGKGQIKQLSN